MNVVLRHWLSISLLLVFLATGCSQKAENPGDQPTPTSSETAAASSDKVPDGSGDKLVDSGVAALKRRDFGPAVKDLKAALEAGLAKYDKDLVWTILGNAHDGLDQYEEAEAAHKKALELNPNSHQAWTNLGAVYRHMEKYDEAEKAYQKALEIKPEYPEVHASLGALYIYQDQPDKAVASLEKALTYDDKLTIAHANIALAYAASGRFEESDKSLKRAEELGYHNGERLRELIKAERAAK